MTYLAHLITIFCIAGLLSLSANLVVGYCGLVSLAQAAFFALGAYAYAVALVAWNWPFGVAVLFAIFISAIVSVLLGMSSDRFKGDQFLLVSLVLQVLVFSIVRNWVASDAPVGSWSNLTNGPYGIKGVPRYSVMGMSFDQEWVRAVFRVAILAVASVLSWVVLSSPFGRLLKSMRDDEWVAKSLGKNVPSVRRQAFGLSGVLAGAAGILYTMHMTYVDPSIGSLDESILVLSMLIIGGSGNRVLGPLCGAFVFVSLPEILRLLDVRWIDPSNARRLIFGLLPVIMIHLRPQGIAGDYRLK
jgi:branched-chain amino acid transport system permease protein